MSLSSVPGGGPSRARTGARPQWAWQTAWLPFVLGGLGLLELAVCVYGAHAQNHRRITTAYGAALVQAVPYLLATWLVLRVRLKTAAFWTMLAFALAFRLVALFGTQPYLSTDVYRYVWDGRVQGAGINPYRYVSSDPALAKLRDAAVYAKMNRPDARTIYPPGAEMLFFGITRLGDRAIVMRVAMVGFEGLTIWLLCMLLQSCGLARERVLLYAWHPLPIWEFAGSGHVDAALVTVIVFALWAVRRGWAVRAGLALAAGTLLKLFPMVLFPAFYRRWDWKLPTALVGGVALAYALYLSVGFGTIFDFLLHGYTHEEGIDSGERFFLVALVNHFTPVQLSGHAFRVLAVLTLAAVSLRALWKEPRDLLAPIRWAAALAAAFMALLSPGYNWYFAWLVGFLPFLPLPSLLWLTLTGFVLYANWLHNTVGDFLFIQCVQYLPAFGFLLAEWLAGWWRDTRHPL